MLINFKWLPAFLNSRSPDLPPINDLSWGNLKEVVHKPSPHTFQELKAETEMQLNHDFEKVANSTIFWNLGFSISLFHLQILYDSAEEIFNSTPLQYLLQSLHSLN